MQISIYLQGTRIAFVESEPRDAWKRAVSYVRDMAHADGVTGPADGWYRTANRTILPPPYKGAQGIASFSAAPVEARGPATENETIRPGAMKKNEGQNV